MWGKPCVRAENEEGVSGVELPRAPELEAERWLGASGPDSRFPPASGGGLADAMFGL